MAEEYYVEPCEFTCAKKFLDALDETNELWRGETWLFRGQNADHTLLPSAMRPCKVIGDYAGNSSIGYLQTWRRDRNLIPWIRTIFDERVSSLRQDKRYAGLLQNLNSRTELVASFDGGQTPREEYPFVLFQAHYLRNMMHGMAERYLIKAFVELADQVGLRVPPDSFENVWNRPLLFPDQIDASVKSGRNVTVLETEECISIAYALARHHRVPTRLLDFTYRPLVASFFAANSDDESEDENRQIVVWAVNQAALRGTNLQVIKHRRAEVGFLQAQDGAFLLDTKANDKFWLTGEWIPYEFYLRDLVSDNKAYKFALPYAKRGVLLKLLALKGITMPSLMPSFDNVAQEIQDDRFDLLNFVFQKT